jgi:hypothetical protein
MYKEIQMGSGAKSYQYMTNGLLIPIWLNICVFPVPLILGSPSSYMTLTKHPIPSEFPRKRPRECRTQICFSEAIQRCMGTEAVLQIRNIYPKSRHLTFFPGFRIRIRINLSCWIRIHIQIADSDPDPGGQK